MHIQLYISNVPGLLKCFIALIIDIAIYKIHPGNFNLEVVPTLDNNIPPFIEFHAKMSSKSSSAPSWH